MGTILDDLYANTGKAISHYWAAREIQKRRQKSRGVSDAGTRSAVTGGAQMDGFIELVKDIILESGIEEKNIFQKKSVVLPGYFRPLKKWDLVVVKSNCLVAAVEAKSQAGPSFGNNFNNRTEEAIGSAVDIWTAYRQGAFKGGMQPFLGYIFMLEDCAASNSPIGVKEPHFKVFSEFIGASYIKRYEILCRKLVLERHYTSTCFITSKADDGNIGAFNEPAEDLTVEKFARSLISHTGAFIS